MKRKSTTKAKPKSKEKVKSKPKAKSKSKGKTKVSATAKSRSRKSKAKLAKPLAADISSLLSQLSQAVLVIDSSDILVYANPAAIALLGDSSEKKLGSMFTPDPTVFQAKAGALTWRDGEAQIFEAIPDDDDKSEFEAKLKKLKIALRARKQSLESTQKQLADAENRAQEMETFLDEADSEQSELSRKLEDRERELKTAREASEALESRLGPMNSQLQEARVQFQKSQQQVETGASRLAELEGTLKSRYLELEQARKSNLEMENRAAELERFLEEAEVASLDTERQLDQLRSADEKSKAKYQHHIEKLQDHLAKAEALNEKNERRISELDSSFSKNKDQVTILTYDVKELKEKLTLSEKREKSAESRVSQAAEELARAWEETDIAQKKSAKAVERTKELEVLMEKFMPKEDDVILDFL